MDSGTYVYCYFTVIANKAALKYFSTKNTIECFQIYEFICKQLVKLFKYALIRKKNNLTVTKIITLVKNRAKY